jgi:hypothetical protein
MDKIETDLVNKRLTKEMLKRQQQILTRLLEHEKAEREREQDEQRQAESARHNNQNAAGTGRIPEKTPRRGGPVPHRFAGAEALLQTAGGRVY